MIRTLAPLAIALLSALWLGMIGVIATQNLTPISLQFLTLRSVSIPFGLVFCFCSILGLLAMTIGLGLGRR